MLTEGFISYFEIEMNENLGTPEMELSHQGNLQWHKHRRICPYVAIFLNYYGFASMHACLSVRVFKHEELRFCF